MNCPNCGNPLAESTGLCPQCDADIGSGLPEPASEDAGSAPKLQFSSWVQFIENADIGWGRRGYERLVGTKIGDYEVTGWIGEGGMGAVMSGIHPVIGKKVAIKILKNQFTSNEESARRFMAEARAVNEINHPNIVDIFNCGQFDDGTLFLVMEYMEGETLSAFLNRRKNTLSYKMARKILEETLDALEAAHKRGIVHRDLKPDNIFVTRKAHDPEDVFIKLLDFGVAKFMEDGLRTVHSTTGLPLGTPVYMSPEQCNGLHVDERSDIYALGVILYQMFTGRVPFDGTFPQIMMAHFMKDPIPPSRLAAIPERLEQVILWCLEKDPDARPQNVHQLRNALLPLLEELEKQQTAPTLLARTLPPNVLTPQELQTYRKNKNRASISQGFFFLIWAIPLLLSAGWGSAFLYFHFSSPQIWMPFTPAPLFQTPLPGWQEAAAHSPMQASPETVLFQLQVEPPGTAAVITVNGAVQKENFFRLPRNEMEPVRIRVEAPGFFPWERRILPAFSQNIPVLLKSRTENAAGMTSPMAPSPMQLDLPDVL